jgi:hypothetical protein
VYPDERVSTFITGSFVPVRIHIKENPGGFEMFGVQWTPTVIITDTEGEERYRFEGFLPVDEFLPQLEFGLGKVAFAINNFREAEKRFRNVAREYGRSAVAPEALYWAGVSKYKAANDAGALKETAEKLQSQYGDSVWTKKASVWAA